MIFYNAVQNQWFQKTNLSSEHVLFLQLSSVPGISFWSGLRKLKFLNLHDNPLGKYDTLQSLATCPHLMALTLYDTPLSLKRNYRHHVVNSIWSLKALDQHVISDEEIIEDAVFGGRFGTLHPAFRIELCPPAPEVCYNVCYKL